MSTYLCQKCTTQTEYNPLFIEGREIFKPHLCLECEGAERTGQRQAIEAERQARLREEWERICPPLYRKTDPKFPLMDMTILNALMRWRPGEDGVGVGLYGSTGMRKTRMMFLLLKTLHFEGVRVFAVSSVRLAACFAAAAWHDREAQEARDLIKKAKGAQVLFIDDLGKERFTETAQKGVYDLLETRTKYLRPSMWTANSSGEDLLQMMFDAAGSSTLAHDKARAVLRRLIDFTEVIGVDQEEECLTRSHEGREGGRV